MTFAFWVLIAVAVYTYCGYPITLAVVSRRMARSVRKAPVTPTVSVIVAAYNEGHTIARRISNLLESEYPADRLQVVVASDGSTDDTVHQAVSLGSPRVRVLDLLRRGKAAALADAVRYAGGEVLVFTDANTVFRPDAIRQLVANFADPDVGGVAGHTAYEIVEGAESSGLGESLYWRYDTWLKSLETLTGSVVSAHGGIYAIRRELFRPIEDLAVTDDFAISTAVVAQGKRLVFEPQATAYERPMAESGSEFGRRVRLMTRGLRGVSLRRELLDPRRHGFYAVALASRKLLRRIVPATFPVVFVLSLLLSAGSAPIATFAASQVVFLSLAATGWVLRREPIGASPLFYAPFFFCMANAASMVAVWNAVSGRRIERWTPQRHAREHAGRGGAASLPTEQTP